MNAKLWACVIMGVLVAHLAVLYIVDHLRTMGKPLPVYRPPEEPSFTTVTKIYTNEKGEKVREIHEFTVRTELADPRTLAKLPAPPKAAGTEGAGALAPATSN